MKRFFNLNSRDCFVGFVIIVISVFSFVTLVGASVGMNHSMPDMPRMNCIFDVVDGCDMTLVEHMFLWQQFFMANVMNLKVNFVFLMSLVLVFGFATFYQRMIELLRMVRWRPPAFFKLKASILRLFDHVFQMLKAGLLQPRVYQPVIV